MLINDGAAAADMIEELKQLQAFEDLLSAAVLRQAETTRGAAMERLRMPTPNVSHDKKLLPNDSNYRDNYLHPNNIYSTR